MRNTTEKNIIPLQTDQQVKKSLLQTVARKRRILLILTAKVEMLRMDLDIIKREYDVRIGRLYLKDDQLDLEIIRYKTIKSLLDQGCTYDDAIKKVNDQYYAHKKAFDFRDQVIHDEQALIDKRNDIKIHSQQEIKTLWKKLLFKLHPDLTTNSDEKKRREIIMKKINDAYAQNDFPLLQTIENQHYTENFEQTSIEKLEKTIVDLQTAIIMNDNHYEQLRESEWYKWRKKSQQAKKKNIDIFKELEQTLLEDIVKKIAIVTTYRKQLDQKGYY